MGRGCLLEVRMKDRLPFFEFNAETPEPVRQCNVMVMSSWGGRELPPDCYSLALLCTPCISWSASFESLLFHLQPQSHSCEGVGSPYGESPVQRAHLHIKFGEPVPQDVGQL